MKYSRATTRRRAQYGVGFVYKCGRPRRAVIPERSVKMLKNKDFRATGIALAFCNMPKRSVTDSGNR
jgi:hypothetical protein